MQPHHILILGGTFEASQLAKSLHDQSRGQARRFTLSLAGRTQTPVQPVPFRSGGFGGVAGLLSYLAQENITRVVDATHPFAAQMSRHAVIACATAQIPLIQLSRPAWQRQEQDLWTEVDTIEQAVAALPQAPRRVFLTHGRLDLAAFTKAPQHFYLIRTIDRPDGLDTLTRSAVAHSLILARGPFGQAEEAALLQNERIELLITKNSGGSATYAKILAARAARIPVILLRRPPAQDCPQASDVTGVMRWLHGDRP